MAFLFSKKSWKLTTHNRPILFPALLSFTTITPYPGYNLFLFFHSRAPCNSRRALWYFNRSRRNIFKIYAFTFGRQYRHRYRGAVEAICGNEHSRVFSRDRLWIIRSIENHIECSSSHWNFWAFVFMHLRGTRSRDNRTDPSSPTHLTAGE